MEKLEHNRKLLCLAQLQLNQIKKQGVILSGSKPTDLTGNLIQILNSLNEEIIKLKLGGEKCQG